MARMSSERETVISIRHQVDQYIQTELVRAHAPADEPPTKSGGGDTQPPHITLGSWESYRAIQGYEEEVLDGFGFANFAERLATFLQRFNFDVHGNDFNPDAGHRIHVTRMRVCFLPLWLAPCSMQSTASTSTVMHHPVCLSRDGPCQDRVVARKPDLAR